MCNHGGSCDVEFNDEHPIDHYLENEGKNECLSQLLSGKKRSIKQKVELIGQMRLQRFNLIKKFSRPTNIRGRPLVFFKLTGE